MAVTWLVVVVAIGVVGILAVGLVVLGVALMARSSNRESDR